jgi:hypothetical protein
MSFPASTTQIPTTNLDSGADNPSLARVDLLQAVQLLNDIISSQNAASGAVVLNGSGQLPSTALPQSISYSGAGFQYISPASGVVEIQSILRLAPLIKAQVLALSTATLSIGSVAYCSGVSTGTDALVVWNGSDWRQIALGTVLS